MIPIAICLILCSNTCNTKEKHYKEFHIIPDNYKGRIVIIFNQIHGKDIDIKGDTLFFRIDSNGILKTKYPKFQESSKGNYFFYSSDLKNKIPEWDPLTNEDQRNGIAIFCRGAGEELINGKMEIIEEYFIGDSSLYHKINR